MRTLLALFFASAVAFFASCSTNEPQQPETLYVSSENAIIPLTLGNTWIYTYTMRVDTTNVSFLDTIRVDNMQTVNGETWYQYDHYSGEAQWLRNIPAGTAILSGDSASLLFPYPAVRGDSIVALTDAGPVGVRVDSVDEVIISGAGSFACYHYELVNSDGTIHTTAYYRHRLGLVRRSTVWTIRDTDSTSHDSIVSLELVNYIVHK